MSTVTKFERPQAIYDLAEMLDQTKRYGKIRLSRQDDGWYCCIAMNTNTTGTSFEVKSEFHHATPIEAADCCIQRMHAALRTLGAV
ncbi:hypothetical protein [Herbaspirillum huttiense]|uniref:Uncharacterized protein n=2 Tax=Herbaspirillum huttiense TaxID=863372 RepID=A0AAJ2LYE8_9BURK|nr:hypothetical protein [Herbaspirillum huttiense]MDR9839403.1 hypothetical protein [Herbaspirillum huttiense]